MQTTIYWIPEEFPGRIGIIPRPRGGDWLQDEIRSISQAGIEVVLSLLEPEEVRQFELEAEERLCNEHGLEFISFPIPDRSIPESQTEMAGLVARLAAALRNGRNIAVHCRQGIGRSSMVVAVVLISLGVPRDGVFARISKARGCVVPDTEQQIQYALRFQSAHR